MGERYVSIRIGEMHKLLHEELEFTQLDPGSFVINGRRCTEHVYERYSANFHCTIRIYTSIDIRSSVTRECDSDAIRVVLLNEAGYPVRRNGQSREARIYRTKNAKANLRKRVEEMIAWVKATACRTCRHPLVERRVKKAGPNQGRLFLTCVTEGCNHFEWVD